VHFAFPVDNLHPICYNFGNEAHGGVQNQNEVAPQEDAQCTPNAPQGVRSIKVEHYSQKEAPRLGCFFLVISEG